MENIFVDFPQSIKDASELLVKESTYEIGVYPISQSLNPAAGSIPVTSIICAFNFPSDVRLIGLYYRVYIIDVGAVRRLPNIIDIEFNLNPLGTLSKISEGLFTSIGGSTIVANFLRFALPVELNFLALEKYPMVIPSGIDFRSTITISSGPAFIATDVVNIQLSYLFAKL